MQFTVVKEVGSFQQHVRKVRLQSGDEAFLKTIVSDYSWWTFDKCDIYAREITSHHIMGELTGANLLLHTDDSERRFITRSLPRPDFKTLSVTDVIHQIIDALAAMRRRQSTTLDQLSLPTLRTNFEQSAIRANVASRIVAEMGEILEKWLRILSPQTCYVHGDLHLGNLLQLEDGRLYPFDYEEAIESVPAFDAANVGMEILMRFGADADKYFQNQYQERFSEELIMHADWARFCELRGWIASCYMQRCCDAATAKRATSFLVTNEPEQSAT